MPHPSNAAAACTSFELKKLTRVKLLQLLNTVDCVLQFKLLKSSLQFVVLQFKLCYILLDLSRHKDAHRKAFFSKVPIEIVRKNHCHLSQYPRCFSSVSCGFFLDCVKVKYLSVESISVCVRQNPGSVSLKFQICTLWKTNFKKS